MESKPDRFEVLSTSGKQRAMLTERMSSHGAMIKRELNRLSAHGNMVPAEGKHDEERVILGAGLSPSMFRGASIKHITELDVSRGHDVAVHSSGTFIYDVNQIEPVIAESNLKVNIEEVANIVEICDGSNSVISKANFDGQGIILKVSHKSTQLISFTYRLPFLPSPSHHLLIHLYLYLHHTMTLVGTRTQST